MDTTSYWRKFALPKYPKINKHLEVDVAIIGGGITGITAAYLFKKSGCKVALIDRATCGGFDTGNTTAHLTVVTDTRLHALARQFGRETARAVWESGRAAMDLIAHTVREEKIDCDYTSVPGYLYADPQGDKKKERASLMKDCQLANALGFPAEFLDSVPLFHQPGAKILRQAKFHPLKYLAALLRKIPGRGSHVFENTDCLRVEDQPLEVVTPLHRIRCSYVVLATHTPITGKTNLASATLFQSKLFLFTSYAVGARIPVDAAPEASFWSTGDPYDYLRVEKGRKFDYAIFGGEDHKTGQMKDTHKPYARLAAKLSKLIPSARVDTQWSGQVITTPDGLPYIGETADRQFAATGFAGNGMTFGTLGAMMAVDAFLKHKNPWQQLYDVHRKKVLSGGWDYVRENKDYPYYLVRGWLAGARGRSLRDLGRNKGKVLELDGKKVAAYRDPHGKISLCSPVCTHLKCIVGWNDAEKTWDCPCHGSRFSTTGEVLSGPAEEPLETIHRS